MYSKDSLFSLIKSMSASEKRYFHRFVKLYDPASNQDYWELFCIMDDLQVYQKAEVKNRLSNKTFAKNLSVSKYYLYNQILKSLRSYHTKHKSKFKLYDLIKDIYILIDKNLIIQAQKRIGIAKKLAKDCQYDQMLIELLRLERTIIRNYSLKQPRKFLQNNKKQLHFHLKQVTTQIDIVDLYDEVFLLTRKPKDIDQTKEKIENLIKSFSQKVSSSDLSFETKMLYHLTWTNYYSFFTHNTHYAKIHLQILLDIFLQSRQLQEEYLLRYIHVILNYSNLLYLENDFSTFPTYILILKKLQASSDYLKVKLFQANYYIQFLYLLGTYQHKKILPLLPAIKNGLGKYKAILDKNYEQEFFQNIAIAYFFTSQYEASLIWIRKVINETKYDIHQDIRFFCRTLEYLAHFESGDHEFAVSRAKSLYRYLRNNSPQEQFYSSMSKTFPHIAYAVNNEERLNVYKELGVILGRHPEYINGKKEILYWLSLAMEH